LPIETVGALEKSRREGADKMEALTTLALTRLRGSVWHTTNSDRLQGIVRSNAILPEPDIADTDRWSTSQGRTYYPYVRTLGGVSLFDFRDFDPEYYSAIYPNSTWTEFIPYRSVWKEAVWIEVDISQLGAAFISGAELLAQWKAAKVGNRIMPEIEAANIGSLPKSAFKQVLLVREGFDTLSLINT
jgi:hypothetical protein